jgi:hypothetical protein
VTYFQWAHGGKIVSTPNCEPNNCRHNGPIAKAALWAWDRRLGAWIHYAPIAWGMESMYTIHYVPRLNNYVGHGDDARFTLYDAAARRRTSKLDDLRHHTRDA